MWPIWQPIFRDRQADRVLRPPGGHPFCRSRSLSPIKFQQHPIAKPEPPARMEAAGAIGTVPTVLGESESENPKIDCEHGRRRKCGWCHFGVSSFNGEVLQDRYLEECRRLQGAGLGIEEWNSALYKLNSTMCHCLLDLSQAERKRLNFVYLEADPQMAPLAPDVLDALDRLGLGTTEKRHDGPQSGASAASAGIAKKSDGYDSAEDDSAEEPDADAQITKIVAQYTSKSQEHWCVTLDRRGLWSTWIRTRFLCKLCPDVEYRVQYNDRAAWAFMSEENSREAMRLAATRERKGRVFFKNDGGRTTEYNIWWTEDFRGFQQNTASLTCRSIRCVILDARGECCAGSQLRFTNPADQRPLPDRTEGSGKSWDPRALHMVGYIDGDGRRIGHLGPGVFEC